MTNIFTRWGVFALMTIFISWQAMSAQGSAMPEDVPSSVNKQTSDRKDGYISNNDSAKGFFDALSSRMNVPFILSPLAAKKRISGNFDFSRPFELMQSVSNRMSLVWYQDGQNIYIYDASEMRNTVIALRTITVIELRDFLTSSSLYDKRFPLRSDAVNKTFYLSAPPVYIDIVKKMAEFLDRDPNVVDAASNLAVIPLRNTFAEDRTFRFRDDTVVIPGMANVIRALTSGGKTPDSIDVVIPQPVGGAPAENPAGGSENTRRVMPPFLDDAVSVSKNAQSATRQTSFDEIHVVSNPDSNSLLVKGAPERVRHVRQLIATLDQPKRHIEMSVWIIDVQKEQLEKLGVNLSGTFSTGGALSASFNGGISSTVDALSFVARITALSQENKANIVSRPMLLTQENVPAIFDNNRTFYTKLIGERTVELDHVTYGTSMSVLPRFAGNNEIEMMLNVEDGNGFTEQTADTLPEVGRTTISTIARVPVGKSLLIGGYTRDEQSQGKSGIPWLQDIPVLGALVRYREKKESRLVRVFLIQPREIKGSEHDGNNFIRHVRDAALNADLTDWMNNYLDSK